MSRHALLRRALASVLVAAATAVTAGAQYAFTRLAVPGATGATIPSGINAAGQIVGSFRDDFGTRGFLYEDGAFTTIDAPGARVTELSGINDAGQIVGQVDNGSASFLYEAGVFTPIAVPGELGPSTTHANGIDGAGQIVGSYFNSEGIEQAFRYDPRTGALTVIYRWPDFIYATASNARGQIVGYYTCNRGFICPVTAFVRGGGVFTTIVPPGPPFIPGVNAGTGAVANGINDSGWIVGSYFSSTLMVPHGFLIDGTGVLGTFDVPGSRATVLYGINALGQIVGAYSDSTGGHAFLATPVGLLTPEPSAFALLAVGLVGLRVAVRRGGRRALHDSTYVSWKDFEGLRRTSKDFEGLRRTSKD
jgi:probable HAF family extracellular repeat protein